MWIAGFAAEAVFDANGLDTMRCDQCAAESSLSAAFVRRPHWVTGKQQSLCPRCVRRRKDESVVYTLLVAALVLFIFLMRWLLAPPDMMAGPQHFRWALDWALFVAFELVCIVPHELGHAAAAWLMGMEVGRITFGRGPLLARWVVRGVILDLRAIPIVGSVSATTRRLTNWRWRMIAFIAAGPMANLAILVVATVVWLNSPPGLVTREGISPWLLLAFANLTLLVFSLSSREVTAATGTMPSDGRRLFKLLFKPLPQPQERRKLHYLPRALWKFDLDRNDQMLAILDEGLQELPSDKVLRGLRATAQLGLRRYEAARQTLLTLLAEHPDKDPHRALWDNNLAWADLLSERAEWLHEADVASAEAYDLLPWAPAIESTRGLLLVETGRIDEGVRFLKRALRGADRRVSKASILCALAIAECYRGNLQAARSLAARARRCSPDCELLPRAQKLLLNAQEAIVAAA